MKKKHKVREFETVKEYSRWKYFCDYYLKYVIAVIFIGILSVTFVKEVFIDKVNTVLYIAILNENKWLETENLVKELEDYFQINTDKEEIIISIYNLEENSDLSKFYTLIANGQIDIVITDNKVAQYFDEQGYLLNLEQLGLRDSELSDQLLKGDNSKSQYGISLVDNKKYQQLESSLEEPVLSIISNSARQSEVKILLSYLANNDLN